MTTKPSELNLALGYQMENYTLLREKLDECGFQGRDICADCAVLQLYLEMDAPKV